jgi:regulator of protease activity HflC (stomatin/prohibitin superfamily)
MSLLVLFVLAALVLVLVIVVLSAIRVVQQYERGVIFVLGRLMGAKGPGLFLVPPFISHMVKVDLRIVTLTVPPQEVISRDNVTIKVTAVVYFYVVDPIAAVVKVVNFNQATSQIGQTTLRNILPLDLVAPLIQIMQHEASVPAHEPLNGSRSSEPSLPH